MAELLYRLSDMPEGAELSAALVRMVQGSASGEDLDFVENHFDVIVNRAPQDQLRQAVVHAIGGVSSEDAGKEVADALSSISEDRLTDFGYRFFDGLRQQGVNPLDLTRVSGAKESDPSRMSPEDYGVLISHLVRLNPEALGESVALQPAMATIFGHSVVASILMHLANEILGGEPLEREFPERPGQIPVSPHGPHGMPDADHVPDREWEQTPGGGLKKPRAKPPKSGPMS